jgi:inner membrane protein
MCRVDPFAHTFTGAALAAAGLRRASPLATAALLIGANIPDVDILTAFGGDNAALAHRRGWTHGVLAIVVWPFVVTGLLLAFDRLRRRPARGDPSVAPLALLGVSAIAVVSHPLLDWLNNYGMRWLMPFDDRWFYGDALFIIDPWVWLALGGVLCAGYSRSAGAAVAWTVFWAAGTAIVFATVAVPETAKAVWTAGLAAIIVTRVLGAGAAIRDTAIERAAQLALAGVVVYASALVAANVPARAEIRAALESRGIGPIEKIMVAPEAANPFTGWVVAATADAYYVGQWNWLAEPRFTPSPETIDRPLDDPIVAAAAQAPAARRYLTWSRFPFAQVETTPAGYTIRFHDARYFSFGRLSGPTVRLDANLSFRQ